MQISRRALLALTAAAAASSFGAPLFAQDKGTIGISMPTKSSARWISDGESMVAQFTAAGYGTDLQYAEDDIPNQLAQIENMITKGVKVLVIAAIDGTTLSNALDNAAGGVAVVAPDDQVQRLGVLCTDARHQNNLPPALPPARFPAPRFPPQDRRRGRVPGPAHRPGRPVARSVHPTRCPGW